MKKILFGSLVALSLLAFAGCNGTASPEGAKSAKCGEGKCGTDKKTMKCGTDKKTAAKCGAEKTVTKCGGEKNTTAKCGGDK